MRRVLTSDLDFVVSSINVASAQVRDSSGRLNPGSGGYRLDFDESGWMLKKLIGMGPEYHDVLRVGRRTRRQLLGLLKAYLAGLRAGSGAAGA